MKTGFISRVAVEDPSQVGAARRLVNSLLVDTDFDEVRKGKAAIVVTEAANNLVKHGGGGEILFQWFTSASGSVLEILALDKGRGMANVAECMRDGYSTAGTPGTGLGAIQRMSDQFDIFSQPGKGTALLSRVFSNGRDPFSRDPFEYGSACAAHPGETVPGDAWSSRIEGSVCTILVADGLGHGPSASEASKAAVEAFHEGGAESPEDLLQRIHGRLRVTRGAAVAITRLDPIKGAHFAGVGNIAGAVLFPDGGRKQMASHHGTLGHQMSRSRGFDYPWGSGSLLLMHSDGIGSKCCDLSLYPGLRIKNPSLIAGVLYRDFKRGNDDATMIVVRERR